MELKITKLAEMTQEWIIKSKTAIEAGYVNNPKDPGKETKCGITAAKAAEFKTQLVALFKWSGRMIDLTPEMAFWIYDQDFWIKPKLDQIFLRSPLIADRLFDLGINAGQATPIKYFQELLNVMNREQKLYPDIVADGGIGPGTLKALDAYIAVRGNEGILRLCTMMYCEQGHHYKKTAEARPASEEFEYGWAGRVFDQMKLYYSLLS